MSSRHVSHYTFETNITFIFDNSHTYNEALSLHLHTFDLETNTVGR